MQYKVLKPIGLLGERREVGEKIDITVEVAENIGIGEYLVPVKVEKPQEDDVENTTDEATTEDADQSNDEQDVEKTDDTNTDDAPATTDYEKQEGASDDTPDTSEVPEGHIEHTVTEEDLVENPQLADEGVKVGDTIFIPEPAEEGPKE